MGKIFAKVAFYSALILFLLAGKVVSRHLQYNVTMFVSDGVNDGAVVRQDESVLQFKGTDSSSEVQCELMYGFLPCSTNIPSHIFLIVIYEYLLYHGESYAGGDGRIFRVFGKNIFVSISSQLLDCLPDSVILLATGLSSSKEKAQDYVITGVGLLAGSSVLLLTILWGLCFICARTKFGVHDDSQVKNTAIQLLTGSGVVTDRETRFHANVMFYSLIPFVIILLPGVFGLSYSSQEYKMVLFVSLCASVICMIAYFYYQHCDSRIRDRRREYAEVEQKVEMHVPFYEVQALMLERDKHLMIQQKEMEKKLKRQQKSISNEEFYVEFEKWLDETRNLMDDPYSSHETGTKYNQVVELLLEEKNKLIDLMSLMMERASGEKLLKEDGTYDDSAIDRFFEHIDTNEDGKITPIELKNFILKVNHDEILVDDEIAEIIMRHFDIDRDGHIDKHEFKSGVTKLLNLRNKQKQSRDSNRVVELLLEEKNKLIDLMSLMMERASGEKLLKEDGTYDDSAIDRFFEHIDTNEDGKITPIELKNFILKVNHDEILVDDEIAEIIMRHFDIDRDGHIDKHEFKSGVTKLLNLRNKQKQSRDSNQVVELLLEEKNKLIDLMSLMMERASGEKLLKEDGTYDDSAIDRFFEHIDTNEDGKITPIELKNFILKVNHDEILVDDEIAEIIMRHFDIDKDGHIDKHEFKSGVTKLLNLRNKQKQSRDSNRETDMYHRTEAKAKAEEKLKAILLLIVGIFMLTVLAEPLIESVQKFSESVKIEPFYVSFILVPLATNARTAIAAIRAANRKRHYITSLTFSEIYHKVFLNNILGISVLVSVINFRGLTWHFSAEILIVVIVCMIMGLLASFRSKFPNWTLLIAFSLYPLSMLVVYFVNDVFSLLET